jgi:hypothetical protein
VTFQEKIKQAASLNARLRLVRAVWARRWERWTTAQHCSLGRQPAPLRAGYPRTPISASSTLPKIDLSEDEGAAFAEVAREYVRTQRYPLAPNKSALLKLAPRDELPQSRGRRKTRRDALR